MQTKNLLLALFVFFSFSVSAQDICGSDGILNDLIASEEIDISAKSAFSASVNYWREQNPGPHSLPPSGSIYSLTGSSTCTRVNYIIPVVIHVVHHPLDSIGQDENISLAQIQNQLDSLNAAFAPDNGFNTGIQFALATKKPDGTSFSGVLRHSSERFYQIRYHKDSTNLVMEEYNLDDERYLNIYVINEILDSSGASTAIGGYAYMPQSIGRKKQGIVMEYDKFGDYSAIGSPVASGSEGKLLVHEAGHFLGLYHPWEQSCNGSLLVDCSRKGDLCCDVAQSSQTQTSCSAYNSCTDSSDLDAIHNYMMYTPDACKYQFTENQLTIMLHSLDYYRSKLATPSSVNTTVPDGCYWTARFVGNTTVCLGDSVRYEAYDLGSTVSYNWEYIKIGSSPYSSMTNHTFTFSPTSVGSYIVRLTVSTGTNSISYTLPHNLEVIVCQPLHSTKAHWLFGDQAGLHFYNNKVIRAIEPQKNEPNIKSYEGSTSISDSLGNLLFYAGGKSLDQDDGLLVFGKDYLKVENEEIIGASSSSQSLITIPYYSDSSKYHVFSRAYTGSVSTGIQHHFKHNVVDHTIIGPDDQKGKVILADQEVKDSLGASLGLGEEVTAIKRCDDSTHWVLTLDHDKSSLEFFIVSDTGVRFSHRDSVFIDPKGGPGFIKFSPDGNWVWVLNSLYRFCRSDGSIELVFNDSLDTYDKLYGVSFSPNSQLLYKTEAIYKGAGNQWIDSNFNNYLTQYSLLATDIKGSRQVVSEFEEQELEDYFRSLQIGPDEKIYISAYKQPYLAVIHKPNVRVNGNNECDFEHVGPILKVGQEGGLSQTGLPNFIDARGPYDKNGGFSYRHLSCLGKNFIPTTCCASSYTWHFGDGDSSTEQSPNHTYDSVGTYKVSLVIGDDTIEQEIQVGFGESETEIYGSSVLCVDSVEYEYSTNTLGRSDFDFVWTVQGGTGVDLGDPSRVSVSWSNPEYIRLTVRDPNSLCEDSTQLVVAYRDSIDIDFQYTNLTCSKYSFTTLNYCDSSYFWDFGDGQTSSLQNPAHMYTSNGEFVVKLYVGGDSVQKTITVGIGADDFSLTGELSNCDDSTIFHYWVPANGGFVFDWSFTGTSFNFDSLNTAQAVWSEDGTIVLIIEDTATSCRDTMTYEIVKSNTDSVYFTYLAQYCLDVSFVSSYYCGISRKWLFGDGDSSLAQSPTHDYENPGTYVVRFVFEGDTLVDTLVLGYQDLPTILGDTSICDTSSTYYYSLENTKNGDTYLWEVENASILGATNTSSLEVKYHENCTMKVIVTNELGCSDSILQPIMVYPSLDSNTISGEPHYFYPDSTAVIVGSRPTGGQGSYTYQWYSSKNGQDYDSIAGATGKDYYINDTIFGGMYFLRKVNSGQCDRSSNVHFVSWVLNYNTISLLDTPCFTGDITTLLCSPYDPYYDGLPGGQALDYTYFTSVDSVNWVAQPWTYLDGLPMYYEKDVLFADSVLFIYRRAVFTASTASFDLETNSNVVKIEPQIFIRDQPEDFYLCDPQNGVWSYSIDLTNNTGSSISITGQYCPQGGEFNDIGTGTTFTQAAGLPPSYSGIDSFRFKIVSSCGTFYSRTALLTINSTIPILDSIGTITAVLGTDSILIQANSVPISGTYRWQRTTYPWTNWEDMIGEDSSYIYFSFDDRCDDSTYIRAIGTNGCGSDTSNALVTTGNNSDIWMRDSWKDSGSEPNIFSQHRDIVLSPDLINRQDDTNSFVHQNAEYKMSGSNYVGVKIRNRSSTDSTMETPLFLYWTYASTNGENWQYAWLDIPSNQYRKSNGDSFPMGGQINNTAIQVPRIAPQDSIILYYPWYPPNPSDYDKTGEKINVCLLARLEECSVYPHRMGIPEVFNQHVKVNAINNNNIVTKNLWVSNDNPNNEMEGGQLPSGWNTFGGALPQDSTSPDSTSYTYKWCLEEITSSFFDYWTVYLETDDFLQAEIYDALGGNPHVTYEGDNIFSFDSASTPCITGITIPGNQRGFFQLRFESKLDPSVIPTDIYEVLVAQYNDSSEISSGAIGFQLDNSSGAFNLPPSAMPTRSNDRIEFPEYGKPPLPEWSPQPNPAQTGLDVVFTLKTNRYVQIEIYDGLGGKIATKDRELYRKNVNTVHFDVHDWPTGVYYIKFKYDDYYDAKRLVIQRE